MADTKDSGAELQHMMTSAVPERENNPPHIVQDDDEKSSTPLDSGSAIPRASGNGAGHPDLEKDDPEKALDHITSKFELTEDAAYDKLGFSYPSWRKWQILTIIFAVQVSMNINTSLYPNAVSGISEHFHVSEQAARVGQATYLIAYAFGSELWAPWSEQLGRKPILQASLFLVNLWQLPCALAPNFASMIVGRTLGGISSAGGSVTLG
jgi:hypothetical protein